MNARQLAVRINASAIMNSFIILLLAVIGWGGKGWVERVEAKTNEAVVTSTKVVGIEQRVTRIEDKIDKLLERQYAAQ